MLNKKYFTTIRQDLLAYAEKRREVIKAAGDAQHAAKKTIFALQRDDLKAGTESLEYAREKLTGLYKKYQSEPDLFAEGSYRAGLEEFVEATLFQQFLDKKNLDQIKGLPIDSDLFVSGLCDLPGEILRYAIKLATARKHSDVKNCLGAVQEIISELVDMDLTGYNRQKFDQAKQALNKLEQVVYELSLKP
ncbi:MAG: hypothetical protein Q7K39_02615 [Candidatus Magasanikbacteria bacterium]|nr:hypothetical protein [Candidatus Magasanikbacteria bacterium]